MTYYLCMKQYGEGCDYTISCGEYLLPLEAETLEEAKKEAIWVFSSDNEDCSYGYGDYELNNAIIVKFELDAMPILQRQIKAAKWAEKIEEEKKKEAREKAELKRLKNKYE